MKLLAHRGNTSGVNASYENNPEYLKHAISLGWDIEIDARLIDNKMWLGHDEPKYALNYEDFMFFLVHREVWWHAKDYVTLSNLMNRGPWMKVFAHEADTYGLVNGGYIWTADTTIQLEENNHTIFVVLPDISGCMEIAKEAKLYGLCSDNFMGLKI